MSEARTAVGNVWAERLKSLSTPSSPSTASALNVPNALNAANGAVASGAAMRAGRDTLKSETQKREEDDGFVTVVSHSAKKTRKRPSATTAVVARIAQKVVPAKKPETEVQQPTPASSETSQDQSTLASTPAADPAAIPAPAPVPAVHIPVAAKIVQTVTRSEVLGTPSSSSAIDAATALSSSSAAARQSGPLPPPSAWPSLGDAASIITPLVPSTPLTNESVIEQPTSEAAISGSKGKKKGGKRGPNNSTNTDNRDVKENRPRSAPSVDADVTSLFNDSPATSHSDTISTSSTTAASRRQPSSTPRSLNPNQAFPNNMLNNDRRNFHSSNRKNNSSRNFPVDPNTSATSAAAGMVNIPHQAVVSAQPGPFPQGPFPQQHQRGPYQQYPPRNAQNSMPPRNGGYGGNLRNGGGNVRRVVSFP
ncbi:hypothetical protein BC830DRAFT_519702, partial [Chytriomyces sp. MP71]